MGIDLIITKRTDLRLLNLMELHYSHPKGFVGRNICYSILCIDIYYGHIIGGSACLHLPNRDRFFGNCNLNNIVNNVFYHIEKRNNKYPIRNFSVKVLETFCGLIARDWLEKYGDAVHGFESLVELPRTGELYKRAGWSEIGVTKGFTCKRIAGISSDKWTGKRVWNTNNLRPKLVFAKKV